MSKKKLISQPQDWWEAFQKQASLEGMPLSEWIGEACRSRLSVEQTLSLSPRTRRGDNMKSKESQQ